MSALKDLIDKAKADGVDPETVYVFAQTRDVVDALTTNDTWMETKPAYKPLPGEIGRWQGFIIIQGPKELGLQLVDRTKVRFHDK